jgi:ABC-type uncharacterized transport system substrate-binding protein
MAFVVGATGTIVLYNIHRPRLLIIHSSASENAQMRPINRGLRDVLRDKTQFSIRWYYTGLNSIGSKHLADKESVRVRSMISEMQPDVILAVGDEVQEYVARHYANDPDIKIVYCAVHMDVAPYGLDHASNATGSLMTPPVGALTEMLQLMGQQLALTKPVRVLHIGDKTDDVKDDGDYMALQNWAKLRFIGNEYVGNFEEWKLVLGRAATHADFIVTSEYRNLARSSADPTLVPAQEVVNWTVSHAPVPVVGTRSQYVSDGGMLAVGASLYEQGKEGGNMAIRLLEQHTSPREIPASTSKEFVIAVSESRLKEKNLYLPDIYRALARASNNYFQ